VDYEKVKNCVSNLLDIFLRYFFICLCEKEKVFRTPDQNIGTNIDIITVNNKYTDKIYIPLASEKDEIHSYPYFDKGMVLPEECRTRSGGNTYIITACYFQKCTFGYCVCANPALVGENTLLNSLILNIGIALENARTRMLLEDAIVKLNSMWSYDMLTKLYNRAGFYYEAKTMLDNMQHNDEKVFIVFGNFRWRSSRRRGRGSSSGTCALAECRGSRRYLWR